MSKAIDSIDQSGDFSAIGALLKYSKGTRKKLVLGIGLVVSSAGLLMLSANLIGRLAEQLLQKVSLASMTGIIAAILAVECLNILIYYRGRVDIAHATNQVALQIRQALFRKLGQLPIQYYDQQPLGRTITRLTADVEGIESFFSNTLPRVLNAGITVVSVLLAMIITDLKIGSIIALSSLPALLFTVIMRKPVRFWLRDYKKKSAATNALLAELIHGLPVIKIFGLEKWSQKVFGGSSLDLLQSAFRLMNWNSFIRPIAAFLCYLPLILILWWGGHMALDASLSIGLLVAFVRYAERFFRPIMQLSFELHLIQDAIASSERVRKLLDEPIESDLLGSSGHYQAEIRGDITFSNVWMSYHPQAQVLKGISFHIDSGQCIGIVGRSGSGKSSTVHLIPQLYPLQSGDIFIDGHSIREWNRSHLRQHIGIVSQDIIIFQGSLRENLLITLSQETEICDEDILLACQRTGLLEIIKKWPEGIHKKILDSGSNLSMGERQLIALTRMLLKNPAILILDEATASVDEHCEALIQKAMREVMKGRTCLIIAHRLSTINHCDSILVFEEGKIVEQGTHERLLSLGGTYFELISKQRDGLDISHRTQAL